MVSLRPQRPETGFDVAQALTVRELRERHGQKLLPTRYPAKARIAVITLDAAAKFTVGKKRNELRKDGASLVHAPSSPPPRKPPKSIHAIQIAARQNDR
jgi:hypothetical protein